MTPPELDDDHVVAICSVLADHDVSYVVIGGMAARLHDTGHATVDVDVCPSRAKDNLARLATALAQRAITLHLADVDVPVASLEDVVESKRVAGRPKDIAALPSLEAHLQRQRRRP